MGDWTDIAADSFREELLEISQEFEGVSIDWEELAELGRRGARAAMAPILWRQRLGETWDTARTTDFLGITRQAVYKKIRARALLGVPGRGTTRFPSWQFDLETHQVRYVVSEILHIFHDADDQLSPLSIASWASTSQPELEGEPPSAWIVSGGDPASVLEAARHAAATLAQ